MAEVPRRLCKDGVFHSENAVFVEEEAFRSWL